MLLFWCGFVTEPSKSRVHACGHDLEENRTELSNWATVMKKNAPHHNRATCQADTETHRCYVSISNNSSENSEAVWTVVLKTEPVPTWSLRETWISLQGPFSVSMITELPGITGIIPVLSSSQYPMSDTWTCTNLTSLQHDNMNS